MQITDETQAIYLNRRRGSPQANALEIAMLRTLLGLLAERMDALTAHLELPGSDPDVALAIIEAIAAIRDQLELGLEGINQITDRIAERFEGES